MKKFLKIIFIFTLVSNTLNAKWKPINHQDVVTSSDIIVYAQFEKQISETIKTFTKQQLVQFKVIKTFKGATFKTIQVNGLLTRSCIPWVYFPNDNSKKYLLYLKQNDNGTFYVIQNNAVETKNIPTENEVI
jgi:citrate lyase gamma subunit